MWTPPFAGHLDSFGAGPRPSRLRVDVDVDVDVDVAKLLP
jgi:hypothetical protein